MLLDSPLSTSSSLLHLIVSALSSPFTVRPSVMGCASPAKPAENPRSWACLSYLPLVIYWSQEIVCPVRSNTLEALEWKGI